MPFSGRRALNLRAGGSSSGKLLGEGLQDQGSASSAPEPLAQAGAGLDARARQPVVWWQGRSLSRRGRKVNRQRVARTIVWLALGFAGGVAVAWAVSSLL